MPVVLALVSQKGGVGKSTLARGLGATTALAGVRVRIADLDPQQGTVMRWEQARRSNQLAPSLDVKAYSSISDALDEADDLELLIVDTPGGSNETTLRIAQSAHLVVQPTGPSLDDLYPGVLLFHELVAEGIPKSRLLFALCRTLSRQEEKAAASYIEASGYALLLGSLPEHALYRSAHNRGLAVTETDKKELSARADALMVELVKRVAAEVRAMREAEQSGRKPSKGVA